MTVSITSCPEPAGGYTGFFADSRALAAPGDPSLRHALSITPTSAGSASARYTVSSKDTAGSGIFEVQCGSNANATASYLVGS